MNERHEDIALQVLLNVAREASTNLPVELLRKAYEIEVKYQFEKDREIPLNELKRLVESYVSSIQNEDVQ